MLKEVVFTSFCFVMISGCALTETSDVEVETQNAATPVSDPQPEPVISQRAGAAPITEAESAGDENKSVSAEYVKRIQTHLKDTGFYSGPVDGIVGISTQSAIQRFQSGCTTLRDLISDSDAAAAQQNSAMAAKAAIVKTKHRSADAVRLVQVRLKDAGFDPGPIDGIHGVKTRSALLALHSGCALLQGFSTISTSGKTVGVLRERPAPIMSEDFDGQLGKTSSREAVRSLQTRLRDAGFDPGPIDGVLGPKTRSALQKYQNSTAKISSLR
jgi:peptidoglycan hydrolase-like protein with peptidoglycan-binding domain